MPGDTRTDTADHGIAACTLDAASATHSTASRMDCMATRIPQNSDFYHFKIFFSRTTVGADPVFRHIFPASSGRQPFFGRTFFFLVYPAADDTHPVFVFGFVQFLSPCRKKVA